MESQMPLQQILLTRGLPFLKDATKRAGAAKTESGLRPRRASLRRRQRLSLDPRES